MAMEENALRKRSPEDQKWHNVLSKLFSVHHIVCVLKSGVNNFAMIFGFQQHNRTFTYYQHSSIKRRCHKAGRALEDNTAGNETAVKNPEL